MITSALSSSSYGSTLSLLGQGGSASASSTQQLSAEAQQAVQTLKSRDREVRAHEAAHIAVGGALVTGGPSYTMQKGPDGRAYAVAGEVSIDTSKARTAEETLTKAAHIRATALAPAKPSAQDRQVAATADQMARQANQELTAQQQQAQSGAPVSAYGMLQDASGGLIDTYA